MTSTARASGSASPPRPTRRGGWARGLVRSGWLIVVLGAVFGAAIGYLLTLRIEPSYSAKALLYVTPPTSSSATDAVAGDQYAAARTQLYEEIAKDDELARSVATALQSPDPPAALVKRLSITSSHDAPLLTIQTTGRSPQDARSLAQAYVDELPDFARSVEQASGIREGSILVTVAAPATVVPSATTGKPWLLIAVPSALLTAVSLGYVLLRRRRRPTVGDVGRLRKAMPAMLVVKLTGKPEQIAQIQPMLFAARHPARRVIFAGVRGDDALDDTVLALKRSVQISDAIAEEHKESAGLQTNDVLALSAPALLDESERIPMLAARASAAVIVCRKRRTLVQDIFDLQALLSQNGVELRGILIAGRHRLPRESSRRATSDEHEDRDQPWPRIDVLEAGMSGTTDRMPS